MRVNSSWILALLVGASQSLVVQHGGQPAQQYLSPQPNSASTPINRQADVGPPEGFDISSYTPQRRPSDSSSHMCTKKAATNDNDDECDDCPDRRDVRVYPQSCDQLGIKYGHCYKMYATSDFHRPQQLTTAHMKNAGLGAAYYVLATDAENTWEPRIHMPCKSNFDCSRSDEQVSVYDTFTFREMLGNHNMSTNSDFWVYRFRTESTLFEGGLITYQAQEWMPGGSLKLGKWNEEGVVPFQGVTSGVDSGCAICLRTGLEWFPGLMRWGKETDQEFRDMLLPTNSKAWCVKFTFHKVACPLNTCN